ncbi:MAG: ABC transporter substrate-binding protein [Roseobacter sp.]
MHAHPTRRNFVTGTLAAIGMAATPVWALTQQAATSLVNQVVSEVQKVIGSGKSDTAVLRDLERIFIKYADINIMAQYALGVDGRSASDAQKRAFSDAFQGYISRKYGKQFREFIGGRVEVEKVSPIRSGFEVQTKAYLQGQSPFDVTFHVSDKSGRDKFFNVYIEGVNLLLTERTEIGSMLDKRGGDINAVVSDLKKLG